MKIFSLEKHDNIAIVRMDDPDSPQNVMNMAVQAEYEQILSDINEDKTLTGLIFMSGKKDCFLAGADISMLQSIETQEQAFDSSRLLHALCQQISDLPIPTVAAIDGTCLGGGLELSLVFDYRVATDNKATRIGVPEVQLGLLPGGGGTARLPRMISLPDALDMMLTGRQLNASRAKKIGLVDEVVSPSVLLEVAKSYLDKGKPVRKQSFKDKMLTMPPLRSIVINKARDKVMAQTKGKYPAPLKILDSVEQGLAGDLEDALKLESQNFSELLMSPESKQFVNIFFATTDLKKDSGVDSDAEPRKVDNVGVLGAGLMGAGISYVTVDKAKTTVRMKDINVDGLAKGVAYVGKLVDKKLKKRRIKPNQHQAIMARLTAGIDYRGFKNSDVVIEAVFEDLGLKQNMIADIEALDSNKEIIFATNTSAIPIDDIAAKAKHPERVIGMHYFSPVEKMPLLEIIAGTKTADWVTATAVELGKRQGKTVIVVNDGPGFYTTRILAPYIMEAVRLIMEGVAIEDIDTTLEDFGMPVGPMKLMDEVGIDVGEHIGETLNQAFGDRVPLIEGVDKVLQDDRKGKKNKRGFYDYSGDSKGKNVDQSIYAVMGLSAPQANTADTNDIQQRVLFSMLNEAAYCLEEGILRSARDGDIGAIFGLGFPPFSGGPFRYMDEIGLEQTLQTLQALEQRHGPRFAPAKMIVDLAKRNERFYNA